MVADDQIDKLSAAVGDGSRVDWDGEESRVHANVARQTIRALRNLARIASFHRDLQSSLDETVASPVAAPLVGSPSKRDTIASATAEHWGTFTLLERVGAGAAGEVWRAWDAALHREVAVKFPLAEKGGPSEAALLDEARALARVRHPGIVSVYGIGEFDGRAGIWMEFLHGPTLAAEIQDKGALPWDDVARMGRDLCAALEALEGTGLVHCDIKPSNVLRESGGRVVLTDFGLGWRRRVLTDSSARIGVGTPLFMSPALLVGGTPTPRTDLYALGVTLRWALTGKAPFKAQSIDELKAEAARGPDTPLAKQRADAPAALVAAIERAMDVSSGAPPYAAAQMRGELQSVLDEAGAKVRTPQEGSRSRSRRWAVAAVSGLVLGALGWGLWTFTHGGFRSGTRAPLQKAALPSRALNDGAGVLSPDGRLLAFALDGNVGVSAVESGDMRVVADAVKDGRTYHDVSWHPDGKRLVCIETDSSRNAALSFVDLITGRHDVIARLGTLSDDALLMASAAVSPDGRLIAFRKSFTAGSIRYRELWIRNLETGQERRLVQVPAGDGILPPAWSPDSRRLAYVRSEPTARTRLESCSLDGLIRVAIDDPVGRLRPPWFPFPSLAWLHDGRLVFAWRYEPTISPASAELRTIQIDSKSGAASSQSRLLYRHPGGSLVQQSATSDGRRMVFALRQTRTRVQLLDLRSKTLRAALPTLAADEEMQTPVWSRDGSGIILTVNRSGNHDVHLLALPSGQMTSILATKEREYPVCLTPDGRNVLCMRGPSLVAMPVKGGAERVLVDSLGGLVVCPTGAEGECVVVERSGPTFAVRGLDMASGRLTERFRYALSDPDPSVRASAALSPDGERLVLFQENSPNGVLLDARNGRILRHVDVKPDAIPQSVSWTSNGRHILVTGMYGYANYWLVSIGADGRSETLLLSEDEWMHGPTPSPDGQSIAFTGKRYTADMWIMDDP